MLKRLYGFTYWPVISISIFYMFQTMAMNSEFTKDNSLISSIRLVFWVGAILLSFITVFYIIYANSSYSR